VQTSDARLAEVRRSVSSVNSFGSTARHPLISHLACWQH